jgi:hypothetical protein
VLTLAPGFDPAAWAAGVEASYEAKGWNVVTGKPGDDGGFSVTLIGLNLVPVTADIAPGDAGTTLTLRSISRCGTA